MTGWRACASLCRPAASGLARIPYPGANYITVIYPEPFMPPRAVPVTLTAGERKILKLRARGAKTPWRDRLRAQIVLAAANGRPNTRIAADLGISEDMARRWRGRFAEHGLGGLKDLPRC